MDTLLEVALVNALIATGLALVAAVVGRLVRRPAVRHGLWLLVLVKLITPPIWDWPIAWPSVEEPAFLAGTATAPPTVDESPLPTSPLPVSDQTLPATSDPASDAAIALPPSLESLPPNKDDFAPTSVTQPPLWTTLPWKTLALGIWLAGSLAWFSIAARRLWRFQRLLHTAQRAAPDVELRVGQLSKLLGLPKGPAVWMVPGTVAPMLFALGTRAILLLPRALWNRLDPRQQETLLTHELAHLRRRDHWVRRLEFLVLGLYFWHPVVWWARRELRDAEEECCDAWVVKTLPAARESYAAALVETVSFLSQRTSPLPLLASGAGHVRFLKRRLSMIMHESPRSTWSWLGVCVVLALAMLLPCRPVLAQPETPAKAAPPPVAEPPPANLARTTKPTEPRTASSWPMVAQPGNYQDAADEVELLRVQLRAKEAELQEAKVLVTQARRQSERLATLKGAVSSEEADQARTEVELREARLLAKEAHVKEAALRLSQAERRAAALRQRTGPMMLPGAAPGIATPPPVAEIPPSASVPATTSPPSIRNTPNAPATAPLKPGAPDTLPALPKMQPADSDQRLRAIEAKVEALTKELAALRKSLENKSDKRN
jgi:beta-lactamase regulating signal transducer with metallopeptidase domain